MISRGLMAAANMDWSENTRRSGIAFIDHSVARSRFISGPEIATRGREDVRLVYAEEIIAQSPEATRIST
jgi:hypothetical protein